MIRSLLYVPASSERFVAKAAERGADAIVLDLEDAVAPSEKVAARNNLNQTVPAVGAKGATVFVRINSEPERQRADAEAAVAAGAFGLLVTKARDPKALRELAGGSSRWRKAASLPSWCRCSKTPARCSTRAPLRLRRRACSHC